MYPNNKNTENTMSDSTTLNPVQSVAAMTSDLINGGDKSTSQDLQARNTDSYNVENRNNANQIAAVGNAGAVTATCTNLPGNGGTVVKIGVTSWAPMLGPTEVNIWGVTTNTRQSTGTINLLPTFQNNYQEYIPSRQGQDRVGISGYATNALGGNQRIIPMVVECGPKPQQRNQERQR